MLARVGIWRVCVAGLVVAGCLAWSPLARAESIGRANLDGSAAEPNFIRGPVGPVTALAVGGGYLYWGDASTLGRARIDGSHVNPLFLRPPDSARAPVALAVGGGHVYWPWTYSVPNSGPSEVGVSVAQIGRAKLDGTQIRGNLIRLGFAFDVPALAIDSGHIYWSAFYDVNHTAIGRANLDGTGVEPDFIPGFDPPSLAVDAGQIYWLGDGKLWWANLDGSDVQQHVLPVPYLEPQIAVAGGHVYWLSKAGIPGTVRVMSTIGRTNLDGSDAQPVRMLPDEDVKRLTADSQHIYWTWDDVTPRPPPPAQVLPQDRMQISNLRVLPHTFRLAGRQVNGRCVWTTRANRHSPACRRAIALQVSFRVHNNAVGIIFSVARETPGRMVKGRCVAQTRANHTHRGCTRAIALPGTILHVTHLGRNRITFDGRIGGRTLTRGAYRLIAAPSGGTVRHASFHISN